MRLSGIGAPENAGRDEMTTSTRRGSGISGFAAFLFSSQHRNGSGAADNGVSLPPPPPPDLEDGKNISIGVSGGVVNKPCYFTADGKSLPVLKGWLKKKSRKRHAW